ncbi:MAG: enoyl-CoA hydratase/isomerase family protein [Reyranella sp.]|nr:enoyl-CoA hydratase/isomerase family protein [Reyranella sp.]MDP1966468.1 enoyl-CoA hydratase/isomerase family protein [Reyranella sp.]MDP2374751.1 enoyl-CoA hydratase/isomerase family protein [Reyranella sp.]
MSQFAAQPTPALMPDELLYGVDGAIATVTLNAPQRMNTISGPMLKQLTEALVKASEDPAVRVVILTGTGRAFCAGLNLEAQSKGTDNLSVGSGATPTNIDLRNTQARRAARIRWHLVPAADAGVGQGRRADLHRPDALRRPVAGHWPGQQGRTRR